MGMTPYRPPPPNFKIRHLVVTKNCLNTIKIKSIAQICHFACDYLCATLVHIYYINNHMTQSKRNKIQQKTSQQKEPTLKATKVLELVK